MIRVPAVRLPAHPGELLAEEFLAPLGISQSQLAADIKVPFQRINLIVNRKRAVTPDTALRFARYFGTSPDFWLNLQQRWDLYHALHSAEGKEIETIRPLKRAS